MFAPRFAKPVFLAAEAAAAGSVAALLDAARFARYDDNYALVIFAFLISIFATMVVPAGLWLVHRPTFLHLRKQVLTAFALFGPTTLAALAWIHETCCGAFLRHGIA